MSSDDAYKSRADFNRPEQLGRRLAERLAELLARGPTAERTAEDEAMIEAARHTFTTEPRLATPALRGLSPLAVEQVARTIHDPMLVWQMANESTDRAGALLTVAKHVRPLNFILLDDILTIPAGVWTVAPNESLTPSMAIRVLDAMLPQMERPESLEDQTFELRVALKSLATRHLIPATHPIHVALERLAPALGEQHLVGTHTLTPVQDAVNTVMAFMPGTSTDRLLEYLEVANLSMADMRHFLERDELTAPVLLSAINQGTPEPLRFVFERTEWLQNTAVEAAVRTALASLDRAQDVGPLAAQLRHYCEIATTPDEARRRVSYFTLGLPRVACAWLARQPKRYLRLIDEQAISPLLTSSDSAARSAGIALMGMIGAMATPKTRR